MRIASAALAVLLLCPAAAPAQDRGRVGIATGAPTVVGLLWHVSDRVAIQPRFAFARNRSESTLESELVINGVVFTTTLATTTSTGWSVAPGVSLLFYLAEWDHVSAYVSPAFTFSRGSSTTVTTTQNSLTGNRSETREFSTEGHEIRGSFGVQYTPHRRFAVFGEVGLRYSETNTVFGTDSSSSTTGNTSAIGAIFYF